ncbi:unnamed protein product [Enterobius vermicularis]|uniref:HAD family hydrolase n=1 Tax=Enterobius vermicularis TaxID=51028 RepID=A0A0N4V4N6_ENTVE|nr:unnamed protein product [Enterobius vermicularis]
MQFCGTARNQKAEVIGMNQDNRQNAVLFIGNRANDVAIILAAIDGVETCGREGLQTAAASDFNRGKFQFRQKLEQQCSIVYQQYYIVAPMPYQEVVDAQADG